MTSGGVEALKAAVRRSLPLLVGLIVLGIVAVNVFVILAITMHGREMKSS